MKAEKKLLESKIEQIIAEGVMQCEEVDLTSKKVVDLVWPLIQYLEAKTERYAYVEKYPTKGCAE